ncbi:hypothetical protein [Exiguobacterium aurantiacum]|uniref:hypothetical protein n=1 Tax=Exiguobacterium aurantiacum TaxID=33987 RepID=UPI003D01850D
MYRDQKPRGIFWIAHRTVDIKHDFIVDVYVTLGNVSDSIAISTVSGGRKGCFVRRYTHTCRK